MATKSKENKTKEKQIQENNSNQLPQTMEEQMMQLEYVRRRSFRTDLQILRHTLVALVGGKRSHGVMFVPEKG